VVMMVGLQGAGKTTTCGKLALYLKKLGRSPLLVPADVYRPAAIEQLHIVARDAGVPSFHTEEKDPVTICAAAVAEARLKGWDVVVLDTAGRLHLDETLMEELVRINTHVDHFVALLDQAGAMQNLEMLRDAGEAHLERPGEFRDRGLAEGQAGENSAPGRVGQGGERRAQGVHLGR